MARLTDEAKRALLKGDLKAETHGGDADRRYFTLKANALSLERLVDPGAGALRLSFILDDLPLVYFTFDEPGIGKALLTGLSLSVGGAID
jgi:hypothetical protein